MQVFDASSIIYAWDNYPLSQFPPLWEWIASQIEKKKFVMPRVAFDEVTAKAPDCSDWLKQNGITKLEITGPILTTAMRIKDLLGIKDDKYHSRGVGENDILIIATARHHKADLVSNERRQQVPPDIRAKSKIPAVCSTKEVSVNCMDFLDYLKKSGAIFR